jgi:hypothetical protein
MVDKAEGQFYTMEGIAAAVLMVMTAYLVMSTTSVYTPGDTHIIDMQLEQVGNDALKIMDTKSSVSSDWTDLESMILENNVSGFKTTFDSLVNTYSPGTNLVKYKADIYYVNASEHVVRYEYLSATSYIGDVNGVSVSRWVFVPKLLSIPAGSPPYLKTRNQTVLMEVLLWRD